jgi:hypothetical protein
VKLSQFVGVALFAAMSFLSLGAASAQEKSPMVMPRWSVKAEYLHADLGTLTDRHVFPGTPLAVSTHNHRFTENLLRFALNYHLP